jgi:hypothetical protein
LLFVCHVHVACVRGGDFFFPMFILLPTPATVVKRPRHLLVGGLKHTVNLTRTNDEFESRYCLMPLMSCETGQKQMNILYSRSLQRPLSFNIIDRWACSTLHASLRDMKPNSVWQLATLAAVILKFGMPQALNQSSTTRGR